jgi:protein mago nashi
MALSSSSAAALPAASTDDDEYDDFYLRYYVGLHTRYGHEFTEFELYQSGKLRYANNSGNYMNEPMIRREVFVNPAIVSEVKRMISTSRITEVDDSRWPEPNDEAGKQELECKIANHHIAYTTSQIGSAMEIRRSNDPEGLTIFFRLVQDLKELVMTLMNGHFRERPI